MERVYAVSEKSVGEIEAIAVAIYRNGGHLGLLHKEEVKPDPAVVKLLHHGWHEPLKNDIDVSECAFWVAPAISIEFGELMAGYCRLIYSRNNGKVVPFGFGQIEGAFDELWKLSGDAALMGLTCATFILAVFHRAGAPLINSQSWPVREEDKPKLEIYARILKENTPNATEDHVKRQLDAIAKGQVRFRPLEVAGAASSKMRPVNFTEAVELAKQLAEEFAKIETAT